MDIRNAMRIFSIFFVAGLALGIPLVVNAQLFIDYYSKNLNMLVLMIMLATVVGLLGEAILHAAFRRW